MIIPQPPSPPPGLPHTSSGNERSPVEPSGVEPNPIDPNPIDSSSILEPLVPLFAPYCGGVAQQLLLEGAVGQLLAGEWHGERRLEGDGVRPFVLRWHGEPAPLETLRCQLTFPEQASVQYEFTLPAYRLVLWLMQRQDRQLPVSFWRWLLLGEVPRSAGAGAPVGDASAVA